MTRQVVILHGWSDESKSFKPLARFLKRNGLDSVPIHLGDYISLRNDVRVEDVAKRMEEEIREAQSKNKLGATFDLIVHSTGGLVARQWIATYYQGRDCPVQNFVLLAPANFGSALAHLGRSMLGRIAKGWNTGFETGDELLHALELGSPYQWQLAQQDLFVPEGQSPQSAPPLYGADRVRPFVIVGTLPYRDLARRLVNENGSDGTVRVAAANLNSQGMTVDFSVPGGLTEPEVRQWTRRGGARVEYPLAVLADRDHGTIIDPDDPGGSEDPETQGRLGELILQALRTNSATYAKAIDDFRAVCMHTRTLAGDEAERKRLFKSEPKSECYHEHFQLVVQVEDEFGTPIPDYFVRFVKQPSRTLLRALSDLDKASVYFHDEVLVDVHPHRRSPQSRNFYIDRYDMMKRGGWYEQIPDETQRQLLFTLTAADPGDRIAYFERRPGARGVIKLHRQEEGERWLNRHSTHFVRVIVPRAGSADVFRLKRG